MRTPSPFKTTHDDSFASSPQTTTIRHFLISGANVNISTDRFDIPISRTPTGSIGRVGGRTPTFGKVKLEIEIDESKVQIYVNILENSPNIFSWSLFNQFHMFELMYIASTNQPCLSRFPASINELLDKTCPPSHAYRDLPPPSPLQRLYFFNDSSIICQNWTSLRRVTSKVT